MAAGAASATLTIPSNAQSGTLSLPINGTGTRNLLLGGTNADANEVSGFIANATTGTIARKIGEGTWRLKGTDTGAAVVGTVNAALGITAIGTTSTQTLTTTSTTGLVVGQPVSGTGIPYGTIISQIISGTQFAISQGAASTGTTVNVGLVSGATGSQSVTANTGNTLTLASVANIVPGQPITGPGMAAGAGWYVSTIASATTITIANNTGVTAFANSAAVGSQTLSASAGFAGGVSIARW